MRKAMAAVGYEGLRKEQAEKRAALARGERGELMGIGVAFFRKCTRQESLQATLVSVGLAPFCNHSIGPPGSR